MTQERIFFITVIDTLESIYNGMRRAGEAIVAPLRSGNGPNKFRLSAVDTATTTHDGDDGWAKRPPATVACPRCENDILQHNAYDDIDCPRCVASFDADEFSELELRGLTCPVCRDDMHLTLLNGQLVIPVDITGSLNIHTTDLLLKLNVLG
jgi:Zn finger protein HypA/HybF involved in hydrogenase expression